MGIKKVNCDSLVRLPAFSHATIAGDFIYVSGILGTKHDKLEIVDGGVGKETEQILFHISTILRQCNAALEDMVKVSVYLTDMNNFHDMNSAYLDAIQFEPPSRITVGVKELALGASVEMECIAYKPKV
ncbi:MAG: RidA family protein [Proteobacteria bacterium]|nr:RidA family protein [Pseudomonadota bacterium]MBU1583809.1 RidA family protein [Pseudomonadota bacterium]MBU2455470.1 RidA family protein [Pseudomonadota bacterium]MBU2627569.1 RidA family protein [Pseudomonadota bacterium]